MRLRGLFGGGNRSGTPRDRIDVLYARIRVGLANARFDDSESSLLAQAADALDVDAETFRQMVGRARVRGR